MKTLINKNNPQIRIIAPEIEDSAVYAIDCPTLHSSELCLFKDDWTLIEEEPVDLEKEIEKKWNECDSIDEGMGAEYANIVIEQFDEICKYFYELGLKARKV